jgi:hypothetical protein
MGIQKLYSALELNIGEAVPFVKPNIIGRIAK